MVATVVASWTHAVVEFAEREGLDVGRLLANANLSHDELRVHAARIPYENHLALWKSLDALVTDPSFGLRMGSATASARALDAFGYLVRASDSLREALQAMQQYAGLINEAAIQRLDIEEDNAVVVDGPRYGEPWPALYCDQVAATYFVLIGRWADESLCGIRVELPRPAPNCDPTPHSEFFGDGVEFGAPRLALHLPLALLERPFVTAEPDLAVHLRQHADRLLADLPRDRFVERAVQGIEQILDQGEAPSAEHLARLLATSKRSLQRHLRDRDTSFQELSDRVRGRRALALLQNPSLSLDECAVRLGFATSAAFTRAFVRWMGVTPARARRRGTASARSD